MRRLRKLLKEKIDSPAELWYEIQQQASYAILYGPDHTIFRSSEGAANTLSWFNTAFVAVDEYEVMSGDDDEQG